MRSAKETGCFPYCMKTVCYFEVFNDGRLVQLRDEYERLDAYFRAKDGITKICAGDTISFIANQTAEVEDSIGADLVSAGYAEEIKEAKPATPKAGVKKNADA